MFFYAEVKKFNNHHISPDLKSLFDHAPLLVSIIIEEFIKEKEQTIVKNSEEEKKFVKELRNKISNIDMTNILNNDTLEHVTQEFATIIKDFCNKYSKLVNITK